jgi:hypothetical protein
MKKKIIPLFIIFLLLTSILPMFSQSPNIVSATGGAWWNYSWNKRILVTINSSQINGSVTNFVALVKLSNATAAKCDGGKSIRFTDYEGTKTYAYDIDQFAGVNASPVTAIWVNISDTIPTGSNFTFYMYYNNSAAAKGENRETCWQEYSIVFHMGGQGLVTPVPINSSCINPESGKAEVGNLSGNPYRATGIVGWGINGGTGLRFTLATTTGHYTKYEGNNNITMFFNIYDGSPTTSQGVMGIFDKSNFDVYIQSSKMALYTSKGAVVQQVFINPWNQANVYHMITGRYCFNTNLSIWDNGMQKDMVAAAGPFDDWASTNDVHWNNAMIGGGFNGYMDEFRLSWRMLSDAYIKMTYGNQYAYSGFLYLGTEEAVSAPGGVTLSTPLPSDSVINIPVRQSTLKVNVNSVTGNQSTVRIRCTQLGIDSNSTGANRTCTASIGSRLHYATTYTWLVNAWTTNKVGTKFYSNTSYKFTTRTNIIPTISNQIPVNKSKGNLPGTMTLKFTVIDKLGDAMNWIMNLSNGARWSSNGSYNATWQKSTTVLPSTNYTWWINVSDANSTARYKMWFVTGLASSVVIGNVQPTNQSIDNKIWPSSLRLLVNKTGVPPTPPIQVRILCPSLGINATSWGQNRTVSVSLPRLNYSTTYIWTAKAVVNGTSKKYWDNESYYFTTRANVVPTITNPYFANGTSSVNLYTNQVLHANITDQLGDQLTWSIHCNNGASASGTSYNATVSCPLGNLKASTTYNWWVNISDANSSVHYKYLFTTKAAGPNIGSETPTNGSSGINVWLSSLGITAGTTYNNVTSIWIHCTQLNINVNSSGTNRTTTASIPSRLHYSTTYHWTIISYSDIYRTRYWKNSSFLFTTRANIAPAIASLSPVNYSTTVPVNVNISAYISDDLGDLLSWSIEINHTMWSGSRYNGTIARSIVLQKSHNYTYWVNVSDINTTAKRKVWFVTVDLDKPTIGNAKINYSTIYYGISQTGNQTTTFEFFNVSDSNPIYYNIMINITTSAGDHFDFMTANPTAHWQHIINLSNGNNIIRLKATDHYGNIAWKNVTLNIAIYKISFVEAETGLPLYIGRFHYQNPWAVLNASFPELAGTKPPNHNITGNTWYWDFLTRSNNGWEFPWAWPGRGGGALKQGYPNNNNFTVIFPNASATFPPMNTLYPYSIRFDIQFLSSTGGTNPAGTAITSYFDPTLIKDYDPTWTPNSTIRIAISTLGRPAVERDGTNNYYSWGTSGAVTWPATGMTYPQGPFYEQDITSTQEKPFGVWSMNAQAWNLLDYTKFITGTTTSYGQAVYTIPGLYYFKIYKGGVPIILTTIDGGKASTIDLDLLEKSTAQMPVIQGTLGVQKLSNHSLLIYFHNVDRLVSETQIKIYNVTHTFLWYNETNNPNEFYVYFDWTTTPPVNTNESITVEAIPGGQSPISTTFIISGMIGPSTPGEAIPPEMVMIVCIALLLFGLTLFSVGATVSFFGPVTCGISLALTAMATQTWYIHMLQFMLIFFIAFMIIVFRYEYTADRSVQ